MSVKVELDDVVIEYQKSTGFSNKRGVFRAVDGVSLQIMDRETLGLVGESGCGKTSMAMALVRAIPIASGALRFRFGDVDSGALVDVSSMRKKELPTFRREVQMIFQDPYSSLDPRMTVFDIIAEPMIISRSHPKALLKKRVAELLLMVGLDPVYARRLPHQFSGGQRQRIAIARALAIEPSFIVADEPTSALDVSVQAQILNLLAEIKKRLSLTLLFISHDLSVVKHLCDRVGVVYNGRLVELRATDDLFAKPHHPYTEMLLQSSPSASSVYRDDEQKTVGGNVNQEEGANGCRYRHRCIFAKEECSSIDPRIEDHPRTQAACIRSEDLSLRGTITKV